MFFMGDHMKRTINFICIVVLMINLFSITTPISINASEEEVRACWVASVGNLDFPSQMGLSSDALKAEIDTIVHNCVDIGLNTIYFQVRPTGDALYQSEIFPWSIYLTGKQGVPVEGGFDPLEYFVEQAHKSELQLHAWINPYRIGTGSDVLSKLSSDNPAVLHPEYTVATEDGLYYNPGLPEVRKLILDGVAEIVENYEIDGIHFDDYFYPYSNENFDDAAAYAEYGNGLSLEDFRRESVNQLVSKVRKTIRQYQRDCQFGISPFGIWANQSVREEGSKTSGLSSYSSIYADSKRWIEEGWLDYICPQIYWSFDHNAAPFDVLVDWWDALCSNYDTKLYIGLALYKVGTDELGFEDGSIMGRQLEYVSQKNNCSGHCFFRYGTMMENPEGALDSVRAFYKDETQESSTAKIQMENVQPISLKAAQTLKIISPENGVSVTTSGISVSGTAPAGQAVLVNGVRAVTNSYGLFAAYVPLQEGNNQIVVSAGGDQKSISVQRQSAASVSKPAYLYPTGSVHKGAGEILKVEVQAPAGATVVLQNQWITIPLYPTDEDPCLYQGQWTTPVLSRAENVFLGDFTCVAVYNDQTITTQADLQLVLYPDGYCQQKELLLDAYQFDDSIGGSQMDHDPLRQGTNVKVCGLEETRALLDNGFWVEQSTLGSEENSPNDPLDYEYECVTISCDDTFSYYTEFSDGSLEIVLTTGQRSTIEIDAENDDLTVEMHRDLSKSVLRLSSLSGRKISGYEVYPQTKRITVYLCYYSGELSGKHIVLDVGHGGEDVGALSAGGLEYPTESELNLVFAKYLYEELIAAGAEVSLLAADATFLALDKRVELTEALAPDLFLSIHHNSTDQTGNFTAASGGLILYSSPVSKSLAEWVAESFRNGVEENGTVLCRRQSLRVCRQTRYPAIMLEVGYLCNPVEYEILCNEDIARKIAKNTVESLQSYFVTNCS